MEPAADRFVRTVVEPLTEDAEVYALAHSELGERVAEAGTTDQALDAATGRLEKVDQGGGTPRRRLVRRCVVGTCLALAGLLLIPTGLRKLDGWLALRAGVAISSSPLGPGPSPGRQAAWERRLGRGLSPQDREFLLSHALSSAPGVPRGRPWDARPNDPKMFADLLTIWMGEGTEFPQDMLKTAERIDPDNAHFPLLAASRDALGAVDGTRRAHSGSGPKRSTLRDWEIIDDVQVASVLGLVHRAAQLPRCESYEGEMMSKRLRLLRPHEDISSGLLRSAFIAVQPSSRIKMLKIAEVISAESQRLAAAGDREGMKRLVDSCEAVAPMLAEDSQSLIDVLIARGFAQKVDEHLLEGCTKLGMDAEAQQLEKVVENLRAIREEGEQRRKHDTEAGERIVRHAGGLAAMTLPVLGGVGGVVDPPTLADLEPGRMAEYALLDQLVAGAMAVLCMLGLLGVWLFLVGRSRGLGRLGERMEGLLDFRDWAWIGLLGVLLPAAGFFLLAKWAPTSGREFGPRLTMFLIPLAQASCLPGLVWLSLMFAVRWRLRQRGAVIGFGAGRMWPGWLMVVLCLIGVALPGLIMRLPRPDIWMLWVSGSLAALALSWVMVDAVRALFGRRRLALERHVAGLTLLPGLAMTALVFSAAVPLLEREERDWVARDGLMRTNPDRPAMTAYEWEVTQAARKELLKALE